MLPRPLLPGQIHSALSHLALISMLAGTYAIYANKERAGKAHWTTWHAWAGLLALALWAMNSVNGGANTVDLKKGRMRFLWQSSNHRWVGKDGGGDGGEVHRGSLAATAP